MINIYNTYLTIYCFLKIFLLKVQFSLFTQVLTVRYGKTYDKYTVKSMLNQSIKNQIFSKSQNFLYVFMPRNYVVVVVSFTVSRYRKRLRATAAVKPQSWT